MDTAGPDTSRTAANEPLYIYPLGATVAQEGERLVVRNVHAGEPAYEQGLNANDQIVAVDGYRATRDFLNSRVAEKQPGDTLTLTVFRADELSAVAICLERISSSATTARPMRSFCSK